MRQSQLISANDLRSLLGAKNLRLIDCRFDLGTPDAGRKAYLESHIPGAVYAHLDDDLAGPVTASSGRHPLPDPNQLARFLGEAGVASDTDVVVYDAGNGAMAARAWWLLRWLGHDNVRLLNGGYQAWFDSGGPTKAGQETVPVADFPARPRMEWVITTEELEQVVAESGSLNLLDARDAPRFRGESEPIDAVAGHVPGARNLPLTSSLRQDGQFMEVSALQALWEDALGPDAGQSWAVMCGSGVTACHLALSGIEAGRREPRVYVGSWSEWIRDPDRPIGLGED